MYAEGNPTNNSDPSGFCSADTCYVFFFTGNGNSGQDLNQSGGYDWYDIGDSEMESLMRLLGQEANVTVIPLYPYGAEPDYGFFSRWQKVVDASNDIGNVADTKVQEIRSKSGADICFRKLQQLTLIGYSAGGQIAYSTAQRLAGIHPVSKVVTIGSPYQAYNGENNIGELWELWGEFDLRGVGGMLWPPLNGNDATGGTAYNGTGWRNENDGYGNEIDPDSGDVYWKKVRPSIYELGATRCIFKDGTGNAPYGHRSYAGGEPDAGVSCSGGNSFQRSENGMTRKYAMLDFLKNVVGIGK